MISVLPLVQAVVCSDCRSSSLQQVCSTGTAKQHRQQSHSVSRGPVSIVGGGRHVHVEPHPIPVPAQVGHDEEAGTAGLGVVTVSDTVLHVSHAGAELGVLKLGTIYLNIAIYFFSLQNFLLPLGMTSLQRSCQPQTKLTPNYDCC